MFLSRSEKIFQGINILLLIVVAIISVFPLLYVVSVSLTPSEILSKYGSFQVIPRKITVSAFQFILSNNLIPRAFMNSLIITLVGTAINMVLTTLGAYPLSIKNLPGRSFWLVFVLIPMLFSGGLIPLFILVRQLKLVNTYWAVILPGAIWVYNLLIMKSFFQELPQELVDAARIDGAGEFQILTRIVLPLSKPVLATLTLFYAVGNWNGFFLPLMFLNDQVMQPLPVVVRNILIDALSSDPRIVARASAMIPSESMKMAAVVITILPLMLIYPFVQRYFTKGVLLGSLKG